MFVLYLINFSEIVLLLIQRCPELVLPMKSQCIVECQSHFILLNLMRALIALGLSLIFSIQSFYLHSFNTRMSLNGSSHIHMLLLFSHTNLHSDRPWPLDCTHSHLMTAPDMQIFTHPSTHTYHAPHPCRCACPVLQIPH